MLNVVDIIYGPQEEKNGVTILYVASLVALKMYKSAKSAANCNSDFKKGLNLT